MIFESPPEKRGGHFGTAPSEPDLRDDAPQAGDCQHNTKVLKRFLPSDSPHYAKEVCEDCGAFIRFVPRAGTVETQKLHAARIARLAMCDSLSGWEREFLESIASRPKLSPKQQACLDKLYAERLGGVHDEQRPAQPSSISSGEAG